MLLCVNANAAIDKTVIVPGFRLNAIHRPEQVLALPGGKGCNVARALLTLGESSVVMGWAGGHAGAFIETGLAAEGIGTAFVQTPRESRTCLSIVDSDNGGITEIYERGEPVAATQVDELQALYRTMLTTCAGATLSGTLPPGVPTDFYRTLIEIAREHRVPTYLDTSGEALRLGLTGRPSLIKPNAAEFSDITGAHLTNRADLLAALRDVSVRCGTMVVLSLGPAGVLAAQGPTVWEVHAPQVAVRSAVGSGDSLLGGIVHGLTRGLPLTRALEYGVAAGTANTLLTGAGRFTRADFERLLDEVRTVAVHE